MHNDYLVFGAPDIQQEEIDEVVLSLKSGWIGTGPKVALLEKQFAQYKDVDEQQVAAVNSGTAALHLSLLAAGIGPGDEVITTAMTFCATVNAIVHSGATPVLVDICPTTGNIDAGGIEEKITSRTRAILPVHYAGLPCDMRIITELADANDLMIIEDCAHAIEATYRGRHCGSFGDFGCFSFYVTKNITTAEGGMVIAKNPEHAQKIKTLALHGMSHDAWRRFSDDGYQHYYVTGAGFKYNMTDVHAALGIHQLRRIDQSWHVRLGLWDYYQSELAPLPLLLPENIPRSCRHGLHLYAPRVAAPTKISRDQTLTALHESGIGAGVHYLSIAQHPFYQDRYGWHPDDYPNAHKHGQTTMSLPFSAKITDQDRTRVRDALFSILGG